MMQTHINHKYLYRKSITWWLHYIYGPRIIMIPDTVQILIHNDSLHAENGGICENEGLIERDRYSEVLLILITVWDWSADNDVGWTFTSIWN